MNTSTQFVLAWLLMLAIPMQGFASAAMLFCAPSHHSAVSTISASQVAAPSLQASAHHHAGMQQSTHHEYGSDVSYSSSTITATDSLDLAKTVPLKIEKLADGKCSACATCCTGSALVVTPVMNSAAMAGSNSIPFTLESFVSYVPEGFDPPPRSILA